MRSDSATVPTETAHGSTNRAGGPGKVPTCGWPGKAARARRSKGGSVIARHGGLYGPGAEPVQGFLAGVSRPYRIEDDPAGYEAALAAALRALRGRRRWAIANPANAAIRKRIGSSSPRLAAATISAAMSSRTAAG